MVDMARASIALRNSPLGVRVRPTPEYLCKHGIWDIPSDISASHPILALKSQCNSPQPPTTPRLASAGPLSPSVPAKNEIQPSGHRRSLLALGGADSALALDDLHRHSGDVFAAADQARRRIDGLLADAAAAGLADEGAEIGVAHFRVLDNSE